MLAPNFRRKLRMRRTARDQFRLDCSLNVTAEEYHEFQSYPFPLLVMDSTRPRLLGWSCSSVQTSRPGNSSRSAGSLSSFHPNQHLIHFPYFLGSEYELDTFFPTGETSYSTVAEVEPKSGTFWFHLPQGQTILQLKGTLRLDDQCHLVYFVGDWFYEREHECPLPFEVDTCVSSYDDEGVYIPCDSKTTDMVVGIKIPAALLQDPIRNGSKYLEYGFNPWNEAQRARIMAHLEGELARLTDFFHQDAAAPSNDIPSSER